MYRTGIGYDVHKLVEGRKLILGGVEIPYEKGLLGHSDADVLIHAIMDSMLGALALGDIGKYFPDTDNKYKDIDSMILLKKADELIKQKKYRIVNIDSIVIMQKPKIASYIDKMRERISEVLEIPFENVGVKATTEEYLGFTGSGEGVKALSTCLLVGSDPYN
ncbi:MAG: 2-C-methyl-D-erythritol 2,4-cyclodiphosphate synthase [Candidatus Muiribacteriota bacterium]